MLRGFELWMACADRQDKLRLARMAKTSCAYLYQVASGHRNPSPALAGRIAKATEKLNAETSGRLPVVRRGALSSVCRACEYYKNCGAGE